MCYHHIELFSNDTIYFVLRGELICKPNHLYIFKYTSLKRVETSLHLYQKGGSCTVNAGPTAISIHIFNCFHISYF